jgi:hypothetical protein
MTTILWILAKLLAVGLVVVIVALSENKYLWGAGLAAVYIVLATIYQLGAAETAAQEAAMPDYSLIQPPFEKDRKMVDEDDEEGGEDADEVSGEEEDCGCNSDNGGCGFLCTCSCGCGKSNLLLAAGLSILVLGCGSATLISRSPPSSSSSSVLLFVVSGLAAAVCFSLASSTYETFKKAKRIKIRGKRLTKRERRDRRRARNFFKKTIGESKFGRWAQRRGKAIGLTDAVNKTVKGSEDKLGKIRVE